jgi:hypothetical protein
VHGTADTAKEGRIRRVEGDDFEGIPGLPVGPGELTNRFRRAAISRGKAANNVKNVHRASLETSNLKTIRVGTGILLKKTRCAHNGFLMEEVQLTTSRIEQLEQWRR